MKDAGISEGRVGEQIYLSSCLDEQSLTLKNEKATRCKRAWGSPHAGLSVREQGRGGAMPSKPALATLQKCNSFGHLYRSQFMAISVIKY